MNWWEYADARLSALGREAVAARMGMDQSGFSRWKKRSEPPPAETVINFARAVGDSPLTVLVQFGFLRPKEAQEVVQLKSSARDLDDEALILEVARRMGVHVIRDKGVRGA